MNAKFWPTQLKNPPTGQFFSEVPQGLGMEITGRCQLRCRHCFNRSGPDNPHELPLKVIERLLDEMVGWGIRRLRITGGEPTMHWQFREVIEACHHRKMSIAMNSNGVYSSRMLSYLKTAPIAIFLISVDGMETNNDAIRGRGTFRRAVHTCKELRQAGQKVMISFHVCAGNQSDVGELIALAASIGVDIKIAEVRPVGRAVDELPHALIQSRSYLEVTKEATMLRSKFPHIKILTDFDILDDHPGNSCQHDPKAASCKAGRTMLNVAYDGGIYPCAFFVTAKKEFCAGNIYRDSIIDVWNNSPVFQPFRIHRKSEICQECMHYQSRCFGGCPAVAHFTTGYLDEHDPTCFAQLVEPPQGEPS